MNPYLICDSVWFELYLSAYNLSPIDVKRKLGNLGIPVLTRITGILEETIVSGLFFLDLAVNPGHY